MNTQSDQSQQHSELTPDELALLTLYRQSDAPTILSDVNSQTIHSLAKSAAVMVIAELVYQGVIDSSNASFWDDFTDGARAATREIEKAMHQFIETNSCLIMTVTSEA